MAVDAVHNVAIKGIAAAVPPDIKSAEEYQDVLGKEAIDKFVNVVGIKERHISNGVIMTSDLCFAAAENLISTCQIDRNEIDAIIVVTQTGDYVAPATACVLQYRLGLSNDCLAYDVSMGCSGYIYGLYNAAAHIQNGLIKKVLLLVGDSLSYMVSPQDQGQMMLAGDAGTATLLEYDSHAADIKFMFKTIGSRYRNLIVPYGGYKHKYGSTEQIKREDNIIRSDYDTFMDGVEVFRFSIAETPRLFQQFCEQCGYDLNDCDYVVLHQANLFIMKNIARRLKVPLEKVPISLDRYGNTSSATIPLTLCDLFGRCDTEKSDYKKMLLSGFGVGMSIGLAAVDLDPQVCLPVIESDDTFDDQIESLHKTASDFVRK